MKSITLALAALLFSSSPLLADEAHKFTSTRVQESTLSLGSQFVQNVRAKYEKGDYREFLQQMDADYTKAKEESQLEGLIAIRLEDAAILAAHSQDADRWNAIAKTWTQERNKDLLKAIEHQKDSILAQKVRSIAEETNPAEEKAVTYFLDLRKMAPNEGKNADEKVLIDIDLESEYKQIHLDSLAAGGQSIPDIREKHLVLRMEKMDQMLEASKHFQDKNLKQTIELLAKTADARYAKGIDQSDLNNLARGRIVVTDDAEKKVASILSAYQGKFTDLTKEMFEQTSEAKN